jgi:hypothetical protein
MIYKVIPAWAGYRAVFATEKGDGFVTDPILAWAATDRRGDELLPMVLGTDGLVLAMDLLGEGRLLGVAGPNDNVTADFEEERLAYCKRIKKQ